MATYLRMGFVCAFALCVAGCGVFRSKADIALQKTPGYQNGYQDGCASANAENASMRGSERRDSAQFSTDRAYRNGWQSGFSACRSNLSPTAGNQRGPIPDPVPGHR
jgi:hypothetical protein